MFSGTGPFTIGLAKNTQASEVIGVELNKDASKYAQMNVQRNKAFHAQEICGDVRTIVPELGKFDRIIMPLPHTAYEFLDVARSAAKSNAIIHLYCFETEEQIESFAQSLIQEGEQVLNIQKAGTYNPAVYRWCIDINTN
jgi:tRNA (guanine37-N1)-methyltransferase